MSAAVATRTFPVMEVFGPTIQGEGALAGLPTFFVRFGGCDYRCSWCDSKFSVEPASVRALAEKLDADAIVDRILKLDEGPVWVTLSGGNPALLDLGGFRSALHAVGMKVCVETQGSRWREWLADVDCLTVSPKPPSSLMAGKTDRQLPGFMRQAEFWRPGRKAQDALKIVVFDEADYEWARQVVAAYPDWPAFLSCGTDSISEWGTEVVSGENREATVARISERYQWLCGKAAVDPVLREARILPQLHVIGYGHARGV